jgi:hypothetical protein
MTNKQDKLYWVATTGEYGSNKCIHVNLAAWTEDQWDKWHYWIPEQERFAFIDRWAKANNEPDWADPFAVTRAGIEHLKEQLANIEEPATDRNTSGIDTAIKLLEGWIETFVIPQPLLPYHYDPQDDECEMLTFEDIDREDEDAN